MQWAPGISNQTLVFMTDVKMFALLRVDILGKGAIFTTPACGKLFGPTIRNSFDGSAIVLHI